MIKQKYPTFIPASIVLAMFHMVSYTAANDFDMEFSEDGKRLHLFHENKETRSIEAWKFTPNNKVFESVYRRYLDDPDVAWTMNGALVYLQYSYGKAELVGLENRGDLTLFPYQESYYQSMTIGGNDQRLAVTDGNRVRVMDLPVQGWHWGQETVDGTITAILAGQYRLYTVHDSNRIVCFNLENGRLLSRYQHEHAIVEAELIEDKKLAFIDEQGTLYSYDQDLNETNRFGEVATENHPYQLTTSINYMAWINDENKVTLFRTNTEEKTTLNLPDEAMPVALELSPSDQMLAVIASDHRVHFFSTNNRARIDDFRLPFSINVSP